MINMALPQFPEDYVLDGCLDKDASTQTAISEEDIRKNILLFMKAHEFWFKLMLYDPTQDSFLMSMQMLRIRSQDDFLHQFYIMPYEWQREFIKRLTTG